MTWFIVILTVFMLASTVIGAIADGNRWDERGNRK